MKPKKEKQFTCVECGKVFTSRWTGNAICCSKSCNAKHGHRAHGYHKKSTLTCTCLHCGKEYHPKTRDRIKFCSRDCAYASRKPEPKEEWDRNGTCSICGKAFIKKTKISCICSNECRMERERERERSKKWAGKERYITCDKCGDIFKPFFTKTKTCKECSKRASLKKTRRIRKVRKRNAYVEDVSLEYLIERDKGRCQLCGKKIVGKPVPHPKAPTIDHIIPIARGGKHEAKNCQLAHFICNSLKRDIPMGQQRMIG